jgi:hypothetical protein
MPALEAMAILSPLPSSQKRTERIRAHPRLTIGKTSLGHHGTQFLGCAGQTVRPSLHSISQTSVGKLSILNYSVSVLMFDVSRIT